MHGLFILNLAILLSKPVHYISDILKNLCTLHNQYLLRGEELKESLANGKYSPKIGDLLKRKADEGVVVNLMQWDDQSSNFFFPGMMGTFDEKTREFFRNTKVKSMFMAMVGGDTNSMVEGVTKKMSFTHHQKYVIMDTPRADGEGRELFAFVGGIDLTLGRWDNRKVCMYACSVLMLFIYVYIYI